MRKTISALLLLSLILPIFALAYPVQARIGIGSRSDEVKEIQEILKTDPDIYPEGYVTGYYGRLTENAIKRLQKKCGLPETGEIDEGTEKCIYPVEYKINVSAPNGGESWDRIEIQTIKWEVIAPSGEGIKLYPFWSKASIDLFRKVVVTMPCAPGETCEPVEKSIFVKHVATVNLFDMTYSWKISNDIPNGTGYVIRISFGQGIYLIWQYEKIGQLLPPAGEIWPVTPQSKFINWDESDGTFEITGEVKPCACPVCPNFKEVIVILERIIDELRKAIDLLR